jgi:hypothetical protein
MDGWDAVSAPAPAPTPAPQPGNSWDAVSAPVKPPALPDTAPVTAMVQQNLAAQPAPTDNAQPQTDAQKIDTGLGFPATTALKGGDGTLPPDQRTGLVQAYKNGTASTAGDYMQSVLPAAAHAAVSPWLNVEERTGRGIVNTAGLAVGFIPDSIARLMYTGAQATGIISKDISVDEMPTVSDAFKKIGEAVFPEGSPQNQVAAKVDQLAPMVGSVALGGGATLPVAAWRSMYMGVAGLLGGEAQQKAIEWTKENFPNQPFIQESVSQLVNFSAMLGVGVAGHALEPAIPGHAALAPTVGEAIGKPDDAVTPQDINQQIAKGFDAANPKAQDFQDVAKVMDSHPLPETGFTRFYHGGSPYEGGERWLTPDLEYAKGYAEKNNNEDAFVHYVDISNDSPYLTKIFDDTGTNVKSPFAHFNAPEEIAKNLKPYTAIDTANTLHQTYAETGVHPDQVFEDAKENPNIAADIQAGKVPDAYADLKANAAGEVPIPKGEGPLQWDEHGVPFREPIPDQPLQAKIPPEPTRLLTWIKQQGGINDETGDVAASIGAAKERPGLISKNGMAPDDLALRAQEARFLPEGERPDTNALYDAIREDHNGTPQYSERDTNAALDYQTALNRNAEIDRISNETGIDTKGETHNSFWDKVADHMSQEKQAEEVQSMTEAHVSALKEAEDAAKAYMESRGEAWEPNAENRGQPATLEELENERAKENAVRGTETLPPRDEGSRPAAGDQGEVQDGSGQGGRGSEPPGGGEPPESAGFGEPKEGPLSRPPALKDPRMFEDQLHQLSTNMTADKLDIMKRAEAMPDLPSEVWEKLYAYDENDPNAKLTPKEKDIYDEHIKPLVELDDKLYQRLEGLVGSVELGEDEGFFQRGYTPRYAKGRTRSFGEMLEQAKNGIVARFGGAAGRSMRKTVDAQKSRRYYNAVDPATGEKKLIYIDKEHNVVAFDKDGKGSKIGTFRAGQKLAPGSEVEIKAPDLLGKLRGKSSTWTLETALTREIEENTNQRYLKNVAANRLDLTAKLQAAVRNAEFIEAMKSSPEFDDVAVPVGGHNSVIPETDGRAWRTPKILQFRNYYMEPKLADALDDYARNTQLDGVGEFLNKVGRRMMNVMFLNPLPHIDNIFNHMIVQGGLVGNLYHLPSTAMSLLKSFKDVYNVSDDYMDNLRAGASLKHAEMLTSDLHAKLIEKLGIDAQKDPKSWDAIARAFGYNDTGTMLGRLAGVGQRAMWFASDVMTNARMEQQREFGETRPEAIANVEKHMPNYRVPGQVLGSRGLAQFLKNPVTTMFGKYDFGRIKSYAYLLKEGFGKDATLMDRAKSFDRMAMIGMYMYVIYPALDKVWQEITGNKNASVVRSGATTIPQIVSDVASGKKSVVDAVQSALPIGIPLQFASDYQTGRYAWNGEPIINQSDVNNLRPQAGYDALNYLGSKLSYIGQVGNVAQGKMTGSQMGYGALGVKTPTDKQIQERQFYKNREDKKAAQRATRLERQRQGE